MTAPLFGFDAFSPAEVAARIQNVGVAKAGLPLATLGMLSVLAGAFIGLGALLFLLVGGDASLGYAARRLLGGLVFSLGLMLVVVAGAELFTGNNLLAMAWAEGRIGTAAVLRNWSVAALGNLVGALGLVALVLMAQLGALEGGALARQALRVAQAKAELPWPVALARGVLCNVLVCLAVWMATAGRSVLDRVVAIVPPIAAFVALGFEHSVANMFFFPLAIGLVALDPSLAPDGGVGWADMAANLLPVTVGNLIGGSVLVALVYWVIYRAGQSR